MTLRLIPPGKFLKGSPRAEVDGLIAGTPSLWAQETFRTETPQRETVASDPYYFGVHEVTVGQFSKFAKAVNYKTTVEANGVGGSIFDFDQKKIIYKPELVWHNTQFAVSENHPVVFVTLKDAEAFCAWLSREEGRRYVVPHDDLWEHACRAGTTTRWWCGDVAEQLERYEKVTLPHIQAVGLMKHNPFGLFDMHGNVGELVRSEHGDTVSRGGRDFFSFTRSAHRRVHTPPADVATASRGFRVAIVGELKDNETRPPSPAGSQGAPITTHRRLVAARLPRCPRDLGSKVVG